MNKRSHWLAVLGTGAAIAAGVVLGCAPMGTAPGSDAAATTCAGTPLQGDQRSHTVAAGDCYGSGATRWYPTVDVLDAGQVCVTCVQPTSGSACTVTGARARSDNPGSVFVTGRDQISTGQTSCYETPSQVPEIRRWIETAGLVQVQSVASSGGGGQTNLGLQY